MGFTINGKKPWFEVVYFDQVNDDMVLECQRHMFDAPEFPTKNLLVDYTAVNDYQVTIPGLKRLTDFINARFHELPIAPDRRVAYVVPEDVEYGMGRVFLAYIENASDSELFRQRAEALRWLGIDDTDELPSAC